MRDSTRLRLASVAVLVATLEAVCRFDVYRAFGESADEALDHAAQRIIGIRNAAERLTTFPIRGTMRDDVPPAVRSLMIDRAIDWFHVDE